MWLLVQQRLIQKSLLRQSLRLLRETVNKTVGEARFKAKVTGLVQRAPSTTKMRFVLFRLFIFIGVFCVGWLSYLLTVYRNDHPSCRMRYSAKSVEHLEIQSRHRLGQKSLARNGVKINRKNGKVLLHTPNQSLNNNCDVQLHLLPLQCVACVRGAWTDLHIQLTSTVGIVFVSRSHFCSFWNLRSLCPD